MDIPQKLLRSKKNECGLTIRERGIDIWIYTKNNISLMMPYDTITKVRLVPENIEEIKRSSLKEFNKKAGIGKYSQAKGIAAALDAQNKVDIFMDIFVIIETIYGEKIYLVLEGRTHQKLAKINQELKMIPKRDLYEVPEELIKIERKIPD